ncbi:MULTISPECIES: Spo0E family sporulation regulatory protein-aspartic acid phosphatase [Shouchella]|nr:Spo0E family sporulation regulatory protein-aspartic acid phosphatase [Shouchella clausii]
MNSYNSGVVVLRLTYEACLERLESLRAKMLIAAKQYGMSHPIVLTYSKEIDLIHNYLLEMESKRSFPKT